MTLEEFLTARLDADERGAGGCMNCGEPIRHARTTTGWTHSDKSAVGGGWQGVRCPGRLTGALPWPDPKRRMSEVEAKRRILELHDRTHDCPIGSIEWGTDKNTWLYISSEYVEKPDTEWPCTTLRHLAAVYSDHPDYDQSWAPAA